MRQLEMLWDSVDRLKISQLQQTAQALSIEVLKQI
jgi:hypothetical protein